MVTVHKLLEKDDGERHLSVKLFLDDNGEKASLNIVDENRITVLPLDVGTAHAMAQVFGLVGTVLEGRYLAAAAAVDIDMYLQKSNGASN